MSRNFGGFAQKYDIRITRRCDATGRPVRGVTIRMEFKVTRAVRQGADGATIHFADEATVTWLIDSLRKALSAASTPDAYSRKYRQITIAEASFSD